MQTENWNKVKEILNEVEPLDTDARRRFFDSAQINAEILREVESLLKFEKVSKDWMQLSVVEFLKEFIASDELIENTLIGQTLNAYTIIREIGYGGMGAVYLAERSDGKFEQKVALKLLKREMNTVSIRRRFEQERKILASLDHPNIARLLNAGTTEDKIPYIAMEYVEGLPIDDYCNINNLTLNQRLDLFREVCSVVDFAHRNLIVHRDLKPSNILVTNDGVPKLLDFGISKIISEEITTEESATITKLGAMTPSYASPEQLQSKSVTTAADIYALGVILYELLSGRRPFEKKEQDLSEFYKAIIETDPPLPSSRVKEAAKQFREITDEKIESQAKSVIEKDTEIHSGSDKTKTEANKNLVTNPPNFDLNSNSLRGDLDNIILKALSKEPEQRYSSAENFADDIKRHLRGLPVLARPHTFSYQAEKFVKRHKAVVLAGGLILLAIVGGIIATLWQARVARVERDRARMEAQKAETESNKTEKINAYMQKILNFSNPHWLSSNPERNRNAKISDALSEAVKNIDTDLASEPEIQAEILFTIGQTYVSQGQFDKADKLLRQAKEKFDQVYGVENAKSMQTFVILGDTQFLTGKLDEAEKLYLSAINYFRPQVSQYERQRKWLAIALTDMGNIYSFKGNFAEAEKINQESLELSKKLSGDERFIIPIVLGNLGAVNNQIGNYQKALDYYEQALQELESMGNEQKFESGNIHLFTGMTNVKLGKYEEAEMNFQKAYNIFSNTAGEDNLYTLVAKYHTAANYYKQGKYVAAENLLAETLKTQYKVFPDGHFTIAFSRRLLGDIYTKTNKLIKGESEIRQALDMISKTAKEPNPEIALIKASLGENLIAQKRYGEAETVLNSALENYTKTKGEGHPDTKRARELFGKIPE